jgi:hypothetical protein
VSDEEFGAFLLEGCDTKFVRDVHETLYVVPGYGAFQAKAFVSDMQRRKGYEKILTEDKRI